MKENIKLKGEVIVKGKVISIDTSELEVTGKGTAFLEWLKKDMELNPERTESFTQVLDRFELYWNDLLS